MLKTIIIADDNTGANASAILLNKLNFKALSLIEPIKDMNIDAFDTLAISTDSRAVEAHEAYERVFKVLSSFHGIQPFVYNKRIDSTLRGNLGSELKAFIDFFPNKKIAIVPSFPDSKRTCVAGKVLVDGKMLEDTDVAKDPKMPIHSSIVKELILKQCSEDIDNIYLNEIRENEQLENLIINKYQDNKILIFDAKTNQDIEKISYALVKSGIEIICCDPGPLTYYYSKIIIANNNEIERKFVYLIGSVVDTTFDQLKYIKNDEDFDLITVSPNLLIDENKAVDEVNRVKNRASLSTKKFICITTTDIMNREVLNLKQIAEIQNCDSEDISNRINKRLAEILSGLLETDFSISGVFCSGGDTSLGFLKRVNAKGIKLINEVMPLSVFGKIVGGPFDGLPIITKGGMIGGVNAYHTIKHFFEEEIEYE